MVFYFIFLFSIVCGFFLHIVFILFIRFFFI